MHYAVLNDKCAISILRFALFIMQYRNPSISTINVFQNFAVQWKFRVKRGQKSVVIPVIGKNSKYFLISVAIYIPTELKKR